MSFLVRIEETGVVGANGEVLSVGVRVPNFEGVDYDEEFLLIGGVVHLRGKELLACEGDGVFAGWSLGDREDLAKVLKVGLEGGAIDKDIIKVDDDTDFEEVAEDVIHGGLECGGGIGESKGHHEELVVLEARMECGLVGVFLWGCGDGGSHYIGQSWGVVEGEGIVEFDDEDEDALVGKAGDGGGDVGRVEVIVDEVKRGFDLGGMVDYSVTTGVVVLGSEVTVVEVVVDEGGGVDAVLVERVVDAEAEDRGRVVEPEGFGGVRHGGDDLDGGGGLLLFDGGYPLGEAGEGCFEGVEGGLHGEHEGEEGEGVSGDLLGGSLLTNEFATETMDGLGEMLLKEILMRTMVEPRRRLIPLSPINLKKKAVAGMLVVTIVSAKNLRQSPLQRTLDRSNEMVMMMVVNGTQTAPEGMFVELSSGHLTRKTKVIMRGGERRVRVGGAGEGWIMGCPFSRTGDSAAAVSHLCLSSCCW
ncbi:hypothetical protein CBR_g27917 [Chara braunii]|uniref:Uncharacterized protein n=1 Tax=Chara braunii TaxID=69332 RepID=A0A388L8Q9_CHABU|nr:hypothetical protein CBR_g27917 [Chara braunii]|eukprot:GBG78691.1 hypothetical protein CBR_g27917 [Chara braunii]